MKRFIFSAIALLTAATACTESGIIETPDSYGNPIVFDTYIGKAPITKAVDMNGSLLQDKAKGNGARLYAFTCPKNERKADQVDFDSPYMDGALYYSDGWGYYPKSQSGFNNTIEDVYWPGWSTDLAFVAYSLNADPSIDLRDDNTEFTFTVNDVVSNQVDLLVSPLTYYGEAPNGETTVNLQLYHLLSRVGFKVLATPGTSTDIEISSVKLCGAFPKTGTVNLMSATNVTGAAKSVPSIEANTSVVASNYDLFGTNEKFQINSSECDGTAITDAAPIYGATEENRFMMIMPGTVSNASIEVEYKLGTQSQAHTARIDLGETYFKAGSAYEFIFKVATASIEFSGVVEGEWDEQEPVEHPLQK